MTPPDDVIDRVVKASKRGQGTIIQAPTGPATRDSVKAFKPGVFNRDGRGLFVGLGPIANVTADGIFDDPELAATGGVFWFQCPPLDHMPLEYAWAWNDYATINSGMHSNPQSRQLVTVTFDSLLVDSTEAYLSAAGEIPGPNYAVADGGGGVLWAVNFLRKLGDSMRPFQLQWGQPGLWGAANWDGAMVATLRSFHVEERAGEIDARYFTVSFTEYPDAKVAGYFHAPPLPGDPKRHRGPSTGRHGGKLWATLNSAHLGKDRDTLAELSKLYYGTASQWRLIAKASGLKAVTANQNLPSTVGRQKPPAKILIPVRPAARPKRRRRDSSVRAF